MPEAYLGGRSLVTGTGRFRIQANINSSMADGAEGIGLEYGADNSRQYVMSYNRTLGAYANLEVRGAQIDLAPAGTTSASVDPSGVNIASGNVLKVGGQQVVGGRGASLPPDATDLASAIALVNAIKARLKATGGHGLVAD